MRRVGFLLFLLMGIFIAPSALAQTTPDSTATDSVSAPNPTQGIKQGVKGTGGGTPQASTPQPEAPKPEKAKSEPDLKAKVPLDSTAKARRGPRTAALLSMALPGAGQVYNHRIWKVPIIYAGLGAIGYFTIDNHRSYAAFRDAFAQCKGDPSCTELDVDLGSGPRTYQFSDLLNNRENFRRYRDLNIILGGVWYSLNVLDAYVDAHMRNFDVSDDLSLQVKPKLLFNAAGSQPVVGAAFTLKLR